MASLVETSDNLLALPGDTMDLLTVQQPENGQIMDNRRGVMTVLNRSHVFGNNKVFEETRIVGSHPLWYADGQHPGKDQFSDRWSCRSL